MVGLRYPYSQEKKLDITIKVDLGDGDWKSLTFIGDKDKILPAMKQYIKENERYHIDILFSNEEETNQFTHDELFNQ